MCKNNFYGLPKILSGKLIIPERGDHIYITSDITNPSEFIFIPISREKLLILMRSGMIGIKIIFVPIDDDELQMQKCIIMPNAVFKRKDFIWLDNIQTWTYYPHHDTIR